MTDDQQKRGILFGAGLLSLAFVMMGLWVFSHLLVGLYVDALWYASVKLSAVFMTKLKAGLALGTVAAFVAFIVMWLAAYPVRRKLVPDHPDTVSDEPLPAPAWAARLIMAVATLIVSGACFLAAAHDWNLLLLWQYGQPWGVSVPHFHSDLSFFVFKYPLLRALSSLSLGIGLTGLAMSFAAHALTGGIRFDAQKSMLGPRAFRALAYHFAFIAACLSVRLFLDRYQLLFEREGVVSGMSYTGIFRASLLLFMALFLVMVSLRSAYCGRRNDRKSCFRLVVGTPVILVFGIYIFPWLMQSFSVLPNEFEREEPYLKSNIEFTRRAYGLDLVTEHAWPTTDAVSAFALPGEVPVWEREPLRDVLNQKQRLRLYYEFPDVDSDRYVVDGKPRLAFIGVRELATASLPPEARQWTNMHLQYTHGFGACVALAGNTTDEGVPELLMSDIPLQGRQELTLTRPQIYFGERAHAYALVNTRMQEFDQPGDPENVYANYTGPDGIAVGGLLRRAALAWYTGDRDLLLTRQCLPESRILLFRDVRERAARVAPFLQFDSDPYPVLCNGRIAWILDAYTTSRTYPYSEAVGNVNYIRNCVKAVVDAYDGTVTLYRTDDVDPILKVWDEVFPGLLKPVTEMPAELREHLRYPQDLFRIQMSVFQRYHMNDTKLFYNSEDSWTFPKMQEKGQAAAYEYPRYLLMTPPGEKGDPRFLLTSNFVVEGKDNLAAWMAGECDANGSLQLMAHRMPKNRNIYGPSQIQARFNQNPAVSSFMTLAGQLGSRVRPGQVLIMPSAGDLLYTQALYVEHPQLKIPELKQFVAGLGDRVIMKPDPSDAIAALLNGEPQGLSQSPLGGGSALELYRRAKDSLKTSDWKSFGEAFDALGKALDEK